MKSILLITKQRFKSNLRQYLQIVLALILATFCISLALNLLKVVDKPFDLTFERLKAAHLILLFDATEDSSKEMTSWFLEQEEVVKVGVPKPFVMNEVPLLFEGKELDMDIQITERIVKDSLFNRLLIVNGIKKQSPDMGEIWLPYHFETLQGVALGDRIEIALNGDLYQFTVSAFVADPHYLSAIFNPTRAWVAPGALSFFMPLKDLNHRMLEIRLKEDQHLEAIWERFGSHFDYKGTALKHGLFKSAFSGFSKLISSILLLFGLVILGISLVIVNSAIRSNILQDYKQIGVLKALGFKGANIVGSYLTQSVMLLLLAIPAAILFSKFALTAIISSSLKDLAITQFAPDTFSANMIASFIVSLLVLTVSYLSSKKAGRAKPIDALRNLKPKRKSHKWSKSSVFTTSLPLPLLLAIRFIRNSRPSSISLLLGLLATFIIILFAVNVFTSFDHLQENKTAWGFSQSDLELHRKSSIILPLDHKELMGILNNQYASELKRVIPYSHVSAMVIDNANQKQQIFGKAYAVDLNTTELRNLQGTHPAAAHEISLCEGSAKYLNKQPGDSVQIEIEGYRKMFEVSAIYQDISAFGQGFRLHESAVLQVNPIFEPQTYGLVLQDGATAGLFEPKLQSEFGETVTVEASVEKRKAILGLVSNIKLAVSLISSLFILIALFLISNDILIQVRQNELVFAQLKSIGYTSKQLRNITLLRVSLLFFLGMCVGIPAGFLVEKPLANTLTKGIGLVEFPFVISALSIAGATVVLLALILITAWFSSKLIAKINPRALIEV